MSAQQHIGIAGAGLVGSLLAMYLAKHGHQVSVFERRPDPRSLGSYGGRSINLALSERGIRALTEVGLQQAMLDIAIPMHGRMVHGIDGSTTFLPYGEEGQAIYSVSRGDLNKKLISAAEKYANVRFNFSCRCLQFDTDDLELHYERQQPQNGGGQREHVVLKPDLLFGADGAFSAIRGSLQRTERCNYSQMYEQHAYKELTMPATKTGGWQMEKNALHIWPRKRFMLIALPNLDGSFTCTLFLAYNDKGGSPNFEQLQTPNEVNNFFGKYFPDALPLMPDLCDDFFQNPTSSLVTIRCEPWTYRNRVALIGDAAHAIVPFFGQGMNAGFEDCRILNELIEQHKTPDASIDWDTVLTQYETLRIPDANAIAELALQNFVEMRDKVADPKFQLRKKIEKYLHDTYPNLYHTLYSMVTFSHTRYSEALRVGALQDALFERVLALPDIENTWQQTTMLGVLAQMLEEYGEML